MVTTAIFAEILIIGLQAGVWLAFLAASIFGTEIVSIQVLKEWQNFLILPVIAIVYVLGILIDRIADTTFLKILKVVNRGKEEKHPAKFSKMRLRILMQNDAVAKFIDYERSRLRIARATVFNLFFIIITGIVFLFIRTDFYTSTIAWIAFVGLVLLAFSLYISLRIEKAQTKNLVEAYHMVISRKRKGKT